MRDLMHLEDEQSFHPSIFNLRKAEQFVFPISY